MCGKIEAVTNPLHMTTHENNNLNALALVPDVRVTWGSDYFGKSDSEKTTRSIGRATRRRLVLPVDHYFCIHTLVSLSRWRTF